MPKMLKSFRLERIPEIYLTSAFTEEKSAMGRFLLPESVHLFLVRVWNKVSFTLLRKQTRFLYFFPLEHHTDSVLSPRPHINQYSIFELFITFFQILILSPKVGVKNWYFTKPLTVCQTFWRNSLPGQGDEHAHKWERKVSWKGNRCTETENERVGFKQLKAFPAELCIFIGTEHSLHSIPSHQRHTAVESPL